MCWCNGGGDADRDLVAVLYDRGFAYALFPDFIADFSGESFGYPTWLVIDPEMNLVDGNVGFGSWDDVGDIIKGN